MPTANLSATENQNDISPLKLTYKFIDECMLVTCSGSSNCAHCMKTIYQPILSQLEDDNCTGLVIDKREINCSRDKKSLDQVVDTIVRYKNRSILRKLALVTSVAYDKDEQAVRDLLFEKGVNIRLFTDTEKAVAWAQSYP